MKKFEQTIQMDSAFAETQLDPRLEFGNMFPAAESAVKASRQIEGEKPRSRQSSRTTQKSSGATKSVAAAIACIAFAAIMIVAQLAQREKADAKTAVQGNVVTVPKAETK